MYNIFYQLNIKYIFFGNYCHKLFLVCIHSHQLRIQHTEFFHQVKEFDTFLLQYYLLSSHDDQKVNHLQDGIPNKRNHSRVMGTLILPVHRKLLFNFSQN